MTTPELPPYAAAVRRHDPDRFLAALFAPAERRNALLLLIAFNHELARAREVASEPMLALIRLQWWREVAEGARRSHEVAGPLADALAEGRLVADDLATMIDAREAEAGEIASVDAWDAYVGGTAGGFAVAAGRLLGADGPTLERLRALGSAYGAAGQIRSIGVLARQGRCLLPHDLLAAHGLAAEDVIAAPDTARPVVAQLAARGRGWLASGRGPYARTVIAAALPGVLAARDLARLEPTPRPRGLGDRLAVTYAAACGRV